MPDKDCVIIILIFYSKTEKGIQNTMQKPQLIQNRETITKQSRQKYTEKIPSMTRRRQKYIYW